MNEESIALGVSVVRPEPGVFPPHRLPERDVAIERVYVHCSGRLGKRGIAGAVNSARYVMRARRFPGPAYHYWLPWLPWATDGGAWGIVECVDPRYRAWHTGGPANDHGIGVALQGPASQVPVPSTHQIELLEALLPWLREQHGLAGNWLSYHAEASRFGATGRKSSAERRAGDWRQVKSCPGPGVIRWVREYRGRSA